MSLDRSRARTARLSLLGLLGLALALAGCGGGTSTGTGPSDTAPSVEDGTQPPVGQAAAAVIEDVSVAAGERQAWFTVWRNDARDAASFRYATGDGSAVAGTDYQAVQGALAFAPGETVKHVVVTLLGKPEERVDFSLGLTDPQGNRLAVAQARIVPMLHEGEFDPNWADTGSFSNANSCAACHTANGQVMTHGGQDVSPPDMWKHSMMGQSLTDPYFQAAVAEEAHVFPHLAGKIEDTCLTCHAPMGRTHAQQTGIGLDSDGHYRLETALQQMHAREGVSCTACHQIQDDGQLGTAASFTGQYSLGSGQIYGPYPEPRTGAMENRTQYTPVYSPHMRDSAMCATCHTLFTPVIDIATLQPTGKTFPEQTPYLEWRNSAYGPGRSAEKSCQACHMAEPHEGYATQIATRPDGGTNANFPVRSPFHAHTFTGGNAHTLELLKAYRDVLGIADSTTEAGFDAAIARTRELLAKETADLEIGIIGADDDGRLAIPVTITNRTGHKLPTAYPSRRVWLHLEVTDRDGRLVFDSGRPDAAGRLSVDTNHLHPRCLAPKKEAPVAGCYEPHHQVIEDPAQIAIYESVLGDVNGNITYVLLHAAEYLKDNRIPPRGFDRSAIPADGTTGIFGRAAHAPDFNQDATGEGSGTDTVHYRVETGDAQGPFTVKARLLYQAVRPTFVEALHADDARVDRYKHMVQKIPPSVEELAETQAVY